MGIDVQGCGGVGMSESRGGGADVRAGIDEQSCVEVAQAVNIDPLQAVFLAEADEPFQR